MFGRGPDAIERKTLMMEQLIQRLRLSLAHDTAPLFEEVNHDKYKQVTVKDQSIGDVPEVNQSILQEF